MEQLLKDEPMYPTLIHSYSLKLLEF